MFLDVCITVENQDRLLNFSKNIRSLFDSIRNLSNNISLRSVFDSTFEKSPFVHAHSLFLILKVTVIVFLFVVRFIIAPCYVILIEAPAFTSHEIASGSKIAMTGHPAATQG